MGRRRRSSIKSRNRALLIVFVPPLLLIAVIVAGLYYYDVKYGNPATVYDQAISECVRDRTRVSASSADQDQMTPDCVREMAPENGR